MASSSELLFIPVFAGQGTNAASSAATRQQALSDAKLPCCSVLLVACFQAFVSELLTLSSSALDDIQVSLSEFTTKESLLVQDERYLYNPVITGSTLFLVQVLRYLAFTEGNGGSIKPHPSFSDILKSNKKYDVGILGFSSGILPACVVSSSNTVIEFISRAVEIFRLALWIGIRSQLYRKKELSVCTPSVHPSLPWSLVFFGLGRQAAEAALEKFNKESGTASLYLTAVMDDSSVTISGQPGVLATFSGTFGPGVFIHRTTVDTLYHARVHEESMRKQILVDISERKISFPDVSNLQIPIRSTYTGELITNNDPRPLIETVLDMLLTQPVNWDLVVDKVVETSPKDLRIQLLNVGPGTGLTKPVERALGSHVTLLDLTTHNEICGLAEKLPKQEPIAIVGMAVNMPGAPNTSQLWETLERGINTIVKIPEHRFSVSDYNGSNNVSSKRFMKVHTGNFVDTVDEFDNQFFKISPREAKSMDPQQRILLHTAYEALEDAGYVPNSTPTFRPHRFGCFIGVATHDYVHNLKDEIDVYYSTGTLGAFLAGRISYAMQMSGPSMVVDTACSSSLAAVYQGARALMNRDCDAVMVGGVNVISSPDAFLGLDRAHFLSPTGQCKPFDGSADGYSRGEGCGVFVLKRLSDAINEQDQVWGVIRGIEVNQSGLAHSITHPHAETQASLLEQLLENSGLDPRQVNVIEAHGTGTQAGDVCELESIRRVFCKQREAINPLYVTSIKANIGHLEAASGAAGLAKLLLMLQHSTIPRQISLSKLNPRIRPLENDNIIIPTVTSSWEPSRYGPKRVAVLNNFGASGSNTALAVEEFFRNGMRHTPSDMPFVFGLSAKNIAGAEALRDKYLQWLSSEESAKTSLANIAYTASARRMLYEYRLAVSASSKEELIKKLKSASIVQAKERDATIVFVFSGQGSQYLGMGSSLYASSPLFRRHIDECHAILTSSGFSGILPIITRGTGSSEGRDVPEIGAFQSALLSVEYALAKLWMSWGLKPAAVIGHSLGEYAALVIAGALTLRDALMLVATRASIMAQRCTTGATGMIAVRLSAEDVENVLRSMSLSDLSIACCNGPADCVVAGPLNDLRTFKEFIDSHFHCENTFLRVPFGYHSPAMDPILDDLSSAAKDITILAPSIPVASNVYGELVLAGDGTRFDASYFARHCVEPVRFHNGVASLVSKFNIDAWIEIGPHATVLPMLKVNPLIQENVLLLPSLHNRHDAWYPLTSSLSSLYASGIPVLWREVFSHIESISCISLPSYPFNKSKFWVSYREPSASHESAAAVSNPLEYSLLRSFAQYPCPENSHVALFETPISQLAPYIRGHCVGGMALCPASLYMELVFAGIESSMRCLGVNSSVNHPVLRDMQFPRPLVYDEDVDRTVIVTIRVDEGTGTFEVASRAKLTSEELVHVRGQYRMQPSVRTQLKFACLQPTIDRRIASMLEPHSASDSEAFSSRTIYDIIFPRVVRYSKEYQTITSLTVSSDGMEGYAKFVMQSVSREDKFSVHPIFTDTLLHVAGFIANLKSDEYDVYICGEVSSMKVLEKYIKQDESYAVYCSSIWLPEKNVMIADAYAVSTSQPKKVIAFMKGVHYRRTRLRSFVKSLRMGSRGHFSQPTASECLNLSLITDKLRLTKQMVQSKLLNVTDMTSSVIALVAGTCNVNQSDVQVDANLSFLGVDSLMSIEIAQGLMDMFPQAKFDVRDLYRCQTVEEIVERIQATSLRNSDDFSSPITSTTVTRSASGASSPRTLVFDEGQLTCPAYHATDERNNVREVISSVLDINVNDIRDDQELQFLGLDSLTTIEALYELRKKFNLDLPSNLFASCRTVRALQDYFDFHSRANRKNFEPKSETSFDALPASVRPHMIPFPLHVPDLPSDRVPLILIHDGSGLTTCYNRLTSFDRAVWAINNPHFETADPWDSITKMAGYYADRVRCLEQPSVILGGWSLGGIVAYEMCHQLRARGVDVRGILLIDAPDPLTHVPLPESVINSVVNLDSRGHGTELKRRIKMQFNMNTKMLASFRPRSLDTSCPPMVYLRSRDGFYNPSIPDVPRWLSDRDDPDSATRGWRMLTSAPLMTLDIPGHHFNPFHATNVKEVSAVIHQALEWLENHNRSIALS
ncbi:putative polyketide synthase [Amanita rubescens]|nr:putative polyketide synthase [Amanita rubescens]